MKVPKEILPYLSHALGFCEERGSWDDYKKICEIIVENDEGKNPDYDWIHEELDEIKKVEKKNEAKTEDGKNQQ